MVVMPGPGGEELTEFFGPLFLVLMIVWIDVLKVFRVPETRNNGKSGEKELTIIEEYKINIALVSGIFNFLGLGLLRVSKIL